MHWDCVAVDDTPHQPEHNFVRVISNINSPFFTNGMPSMQIGFVQAFLSSAVYYQMENKDRRRADAGDAASFNAHIRSRMAMQMRRGHQTFFWPQAYFTPFCDVVLRFESLKRDFDGLMAKIGCPLRLPPAREHRGNRLVPLLADDVVASVRRMYAEDYALVERLAGLGLDELLANATSA